MNNVRIMAIVIACGAIAAVVTPEAPALAQKRKSAVGQLRKMEDPTMVCADRSRKACKKASDTCEYLVNPNDGQRARSGEKMKGQCYARMDAIAKYKTYIQNGGERDSRLPKCDSCGDPNGGIAFWGRTDKSVNASFMVNRDVDASGNCPAGWVRFANAARYAGATEAEARAALLAATCR